MVEIRNYKPKCIYDLTLSNKYAVEINKLKEGQKASIVSDTMFRTMFQNKNRIKYSVKLLSCILDVSYEELLKSIRLYKNDVDKEYNSDKNQRCDYVAEINGSYVNIEVNNNSSLQTMERNIQYLNSIYALNVEEGSDYKYNQVIQINLNNFSFDKKNKEIEIYSIQNEEGEVLTKNITYIQIYIPKIRERWYNVGKEKLNDFEKCILALAEPDIAKAKDISIGDDIMEDYVKESEKVCKEKNFGQSYDKEWALKDEWQRVGLQQGMLKGIEQGIEQGKQEGIKEASIKIAKKLLNKGMNIEEVSELTGLPVSKVEKFKN